MGGEETVTLNLSQMPSHTHSRGSMNIYGAFPIEAAELASMSFSGVVSYISGASGTYGAFQGVKYSTNRNIITITGSRNWTGSSSSTGGSKSHNNMPPYQVVAIWKRTA